MYLNQALLCSLAFLISSRVRPVFGNNNGSSITTLWESWKTSYNKTYPNNSTEALHKKSFLENAALVHEHNEAYTTAGKMPYGLELNEFADLDSQTFSQIYCGARPENHNTSDLELLTSHHFQNIAEDEVEAGQNSGFDWRKHGKVTQVKNQGQCGSCWSFAATGALESQILIRNRPRQLLSEEQILECDKQDWGCNGGIPTGAWKYIREAGGLEPQGEYPYTSFYGQVGRCEYNSAEGVVQVKRMHRIESQPATIKKALRAQGPLAICVNGSEMQMYRGGILSCRSSRTDHAVLLVGYGTRHGEDYWILKNSWGKSWGENGYVRVSRRVGSDCGVTEFPASVQIV